MGARSLLPEVSIIAENGTFNFLGRLPYTASTSVLCKVWRVKLQLGHRVNWIIPLAR